MTRKLICAAAAALFVLGLGLLPVGDSVADEAATVKLFNGKDLTGWKRFLDPKAKDANPDNVWTVKDGVITCAGKPAGYIITEKEYENYVLKFQWRWGASPGNSGVFVHVVGEDKIWPKGVEGQLMASRAGDFWLVGDFKLKVDQKRQDAKTPRHYFRVKVNEKDEIEKPVGEWNQYVVTCKGDTVKLEINGHVVNEGTEAELTKGKILLQSEGAEIHFRNIELTPIK
jgi:hypothetical protein